MIMDDDSSHAFVVGCLLGIMVAFSVTFFLNQEAWRTDAIERGFAEYNQTTGELQWKTNVVTVG